MRSGTLDKGRQRAHLASPVLRANPLLTKKLRRMRLDPSFCEVQPARALYRGGVNNGGCIYESEKVCSKPFPFVPLGRIHPASCDAQLAIRVECLRSTRFLVANLRSASRNPRVVGRPQGARRRLQLAESMPGMCAWCRQSCLVWLQTREPQSASRNPRAVGQSQAAARRLQLAASRPGMC